MNVLQKVVARPLNPSAYAAYLQEYHFTCPAELVNLFTEIRVCQHATVSVKPLSFRKTGARHAALRLVLLAGTVPLFRLCVHGKIFATD